MTPVHIDASIVAQDLGFEPFDHDAEGLRSPAGGNAAWTSGAIG
jgi:hypothetical protein